MLFSENLLNILKFLDSQHGKLTEGPRGKDSKPWLELRAIVSRAGMFDFYVINLGFRPLLWASLFGSPYVLPDGKSCSLTTVAISESQVGQPFTDLNGVFSSNTSHTMPHTGPDLTILDDDY